MERENMFSPETSKYKCTPKVQNNKMNRMKTIQSIKYQVPSQKQIDFLSELDKCDVHMTCEKWVTLVSMRRKES